MAQMQGPGLPCIVGETGVRGVSAGMSNPHGISAHKARRLSQVWGVESVRGWCARQAGARHWLCSPVAPCALGSRTGRGPAPSGHQTQSPGHGLLPEAGGRPPSVLGGPFSSMGALLAPRG